MINTGATPAILNDGLDTRLPGGPYFRIEGTGISVVVGDFKLVGNFLIERTINMSGQQRLTLAASQVAVTDTDDNPLFGGVSVTDGAGILLLLPDRTLPDGSIQTGGIAGSLEASVDLSGLIPGVSFSDRFGVAINQTSSAIDEAIMIGDEALRLNLLPGPYTRVEGKGVDLEIFGQTLSGNFAFEQVTSYGDDGALGGGDDTSVTRIAASDVSLRLGDGTTDFVTLTEGSGSFIINPEGETGFAGELGGTVSLNIPGVEFSGALTLQINNTGEAIDETFAVGGVDQQLILAAGNYVRIGASNIELEIAGQTLSGNFFFEQSTTPGANGAPDERILVLAATNVALFIGDDNGTDDVLTDDTGVRVSNGDLAFLVTSAGLAGQISASAAIRIPDIVDVSVGAITVAINNTTAAVNETIVVPDGGVGTSLVLDLAAGPYLFVNIDDLELDIFGQTLSGDFSFEQATSAGVDGVLNTTDDEKIIKIAAKDVELFLGDDGGTSGVENDSDDVGVRISGGTAAFLVTSAGFAGEVSAGASVYFQPGTAISVAQVRVAINNTNAAINESFIVGDTTETLSLVAGPYVRVEVNDIEVEIAGQVIGGNFAFERITDLGDDNAVGGSGVDADVTITRIEASDVRLRIGADGRDFVLVSNGQGFLELGSANSGLFGQLSANVAVDVPGVSVSGTLGIQFNTTAVTQTIDVGDGVMVDLESGAIVVTGLNVSLTVAGQTLSGSFTFKKAPTPGLDGDISLTADNGSVVVIAMTDVSLGLGDGETEFVSLSEGQGALIITAAGVAGQLSADVAINIPEVTFTGTFGLTINTTSDPIPETTFMVGAEEIVLQINESGPFIRVEGGEGVTPAAEKVQLSIAGQTLKANISFEQITTAGGNKVVKIAVDDVELFLGDSVNDLGVVIGPKTLTESTDYTVDVANDEVTLPAGFSIGADEQLFINILRSDDSLMQRFVLENGDSLTLALSEDIASGGDIKVVESAGGSLLVTPQGIAGEIKGNVTLTQALKDALGIDVDVDVQLGLQVNNLPIAVEEDFEVGGVTRTLDLPAGPYLRATADLTLEIESVTVQGTFFFEQATLMTNSGDLAITRVGAVDVTIGSDPDVSGDFSGLVDGQGLILIVDRGASTQVAGKISGRISAAGSTTVGVEFNTQNIAIQDTVELNGIELSLDLAAGPFFQVIASVDLNFGDIIEIRGDLVAGNNGFGGVGLEIFVGKGPSLLEDGSANPDAVGVLVTNATISVINGAAAGQFALYATGTLALVGLDGLVVQGTVTLQINTTAEAETPNGAPAPINPNTFQFIGSGVTFSVGDLFSVSGNLSLTRKPNGTLDVALANAAVSINVDGQEAFSISGNAGFVISPTEGFRMQSFRINEFSIFDQIGIEAPTPGSGESAAVFFPTADLAAPIAGGALLRTDFIAEQTTICTT